MISEPIIQLILATITAGVGICSVVIAIFTLRQNNKMIEASTRPVVKVYLTRIYIQTLQFYLVLKNFGSSSARITSFECDFDLSQISYEEFGTPFSRIVGTELAPGQKIYTAFAPMKFITFMEHWRSQHEQPFLIVFKLSYTSDSGLEYDEEVSINLSYSDDLTSGRPTIDSIDKALKYSMHALEQIAENNI